MMARSLAALGRIDEAMHALTRGLEANPETSELWLFQAELHQHNRDTDAAIQSCNRAIDANPRDVDAWRFKSVLLIGSRRFTEAIACCDAGLRHHHAAGELLNNKGVALMRINEPASAIKCFETAVQVEPGLAIAWRNLGTQLLGTDRNEEGQQYLQRAQSLESRR
jgi:tetratricopeptide (TPR) repeat protein